MKFAHVLNPVRVEPSSDLFVAQPITFESMRVARENAEPEVDVELCAVFYPEDADHVPAGFRRLRTLDRSVLDLGKFELQRKYPLLVDILGRLAEAVPSADYLIYTNVDIALMPTFYTDVADLIAQGYDALTITRRTIPKKYTNPSELPLMYAEPGEPHPGHDCFIFKREALAQYDLGNICIGVHWIGRALELNQICTAKRYAAVKDRHMTFHLGDDRPWRDDRLRDFANFNQAELRRILLKFQADNRLVNCPEVDDLIRRFATELKEKPSLWQKLKSRFS